MLAGSIAHEIRNPFSKLKYHFERIDADMFGSDVTLGHFASDGMKKLYQELAESKKAVSLGTRFIDAILSEINGSGFSSDQFSYYSAGELTLDALNDFSFLKEGHRSRITAHLDDDFIFYGSETLFSFVVYNLLKNASDYFDSHIGSRIDIQLYRGETENRLVVSDTGPGISEANQSRVFDDFFTYGKKNGTGLGLAYCRRVMEAFGGTITCISAVDEYTEFTPTFPSIDEQRHERSLHQTLTPYLNHKRGLVIGSTQNCERLTEYLLGDFDLCLSQADSINNALNITSEKALDFVLISESNHAHSNDIVTALRQRFDMRNVPMFWCSTDSSEERSDYDDNALFQGEVISHNKLSFWRSLSQLANAGAFNLLGSLAGKRILVVDDIQANRLLVQAYLSAEGVEVFSSNIRIGSD
ncbi:hypothetical protein AT251_22985 [Enterovibrio nigricans]|nr:hybrid sensor histidine kinase/response regulator [Enterovibrio nigricans]PKF48870.1 hypothetical protein AT251_22985 [Enterovibrio nigricans]